jgi:hypothetical protein
MSEFSDKLRLFFVAVFLAFLTWAAIAFFIYRFRHPEMTETQLLLHFWDALMFR